MNKIFHVSNNKKIPVNLYFQPFFISNNNSRNCTYRTNTDANISNILNKSKKWNLSDMIDIKKKLNLIIKKGINFKINNQKNKKLSTLSQLQMNNNEQSLGGKFNLNTTTRNKKLLSSYNNSKKKASHDSHKSNKRNIVKKKINFSNLSYNSFNNNKTNPLKKKKIKNKIKNKIPFNINKININIINNNNININTIKTEGNYNTNHEQSRFHKQKKKNYTLDKLPHYDELLKKNNTKEKEKLIVHKLKINNFNNLSKKRNISNNISNNNSTNYSLSNRLNNIAYTHNEINVISKNFIKNIKKNSIKIKNIINNEKSLEHKKIIPINYFQDYKMKNSSKNKKLKKEFINFGNIKKIKNIKQNFNKTRKNKNGRNNIFISKSKRPFSKEEKTNNFLKIKDISKDKIIKNKIFKILAKKGSHPKKLLFKKIIKRKYSNAINIVSRSETKKREIKYNDKTKNDISQKIYIYNDNECDIDDILQNKKMPEGETDNFDDLYSIIKKINFNSIKDKDIVFTIENNNNYLDYKNKFEKIWKKHIYNSYINT